MAEAQDPHPDGHDLDAETLAVMREFTEQIIAERAARGPRRTAREVILTDPTLRPYSMRLTAREKYRVRMAANQRGVSPSELARQFILEGLFRAETVDRARNGEPKVDPRIQALKLALLNAYDLVEQLDRADPPEA